jgi:hypothetical protein
MKLPDHVREFLQEPRYASLATVGVDGSPHQTFTWYTLESDDRILINSRIGRRWPADLLRERRVAIGVADTADQNRWVGLRGELAEVVDDVALARRDIAAIAHRYTPVEGPPDPGMLARFKTEPRISFRVRLTGLHDHLSWTG